MIQRAIDKLIFDRLAAHGSVFLPDIGSLKCVRIAAEIASDGSGFTAPRYVIEYSPVPSGMAVPDLIVRTQGVAPEEADAEYRRWLADADRGGNGSRYEIHEVGTLDLYEGGTAVFATAAELTPYLNPFDQEIPVSEPAETEIPAPPAVPLPPPYPPAPSKSVQPPKAARRPKKEGKLSGEFWKTMTVVLAFLLAFAIAIILLDPPQIGGTINSTVRIVHDNPVPAVPETRAEDSTGTAPQPNGAGAVSPDTAVYRNRILLGGKSDSEKPYHIIAGSFKSKEKAETMRKEKAGDNENILILYDKRRDLYMVSVAQFATRKEAQRELNRLPILYYPESYWIYEENQAAEK